MITHQLDRKVPHQPGWRHIAPGYIILMTVAQAEGWLAAKLSCKPLQILNMNYRHVPQCHLLACISDGAECNTNHRAMHAMHIKWCNSQFLALPEPENSCLALLRMQTAKNFS